jgi:glycosyltransferase involved in cell wall biosynthesis
MAGVDTGQAEVSCPAVRGRIAINAHVLTSEQDYRRAGVSRYIYNLLTHVLREDPEGEYTVLVNSRSALLLSCKLKRSRLPTDHPLVRILWEQILQPLELIQEGIVLLHSPVNVQPLFLPCRGVLTVTDLSFWGFPEAFRTSQRVYQRQFTRLSVHRAHRVIAISNSTAQDLMRFFGVPAERISVVFPGVDERYKPIRDEARLTQLRHSRNLPRRFILFVGTLEPRKNLVTLLQAYQRFRASNRDYQLVLAGGKGWLYEPIFAAIEELGLQGDVIVPGFVPEDELPLWYSAADIFVYPSLYEGFGLPPLEAMACGTPVIVSNTSSLPEVVGEAGLLVAPRDPDEWASALLGLTRDSDLRADMASRGLARAQEFSWARMARETIQVYRDVLSGGR